MLRRLKPAPTYYRLLNGVISIFKPEGEPTPDVVNKLKFILSRDLNSSLCYFEDDDIISDVATLDSENKRQNLLLSNSNSNSNNNSTTLSTLSQKHSLQQLTDTSIISNIISDSNNSFNQKDADVLHSNFDSNHNNSNNSVSVSVTNSQNNFDDNNSNINDDANNDISSSISNDNDYNRLIQTDSKLKLIFGDRYIPSDFKVSYVDGLSKHSSGVLLLGIGNEGRESVKQIGHSRYLRVYHVKGRLGLCTDNLTPKGKLLERASFRHVTQGKLDKLCATTQSAFTREMYRYSGISPDSQEAYELASSGIIRPAERRMPPVLYGLKCIHFQPPDFTLEIHAINERCKFFHKLIHDMAIQLKSRAVCTGVRRLRYGHFGIDRALVRPQWNLEEFLKNIELNQKSLLSEFESEYNNS